MGWLRKLFAFPDPDRLPVVDKTCPRCGAAVEVPVVSGRHPVARGFGVTFPPTVAAVVRACGIERAGRPAVPEWRARARNRRRSW